MLTFVQGINTELTNGLLGIMLLVSVCLVCLTSFFFTTNDIGKSVAATSYIAMFLSIILLAMDLVPTLVMFMTVVLASAAMAITWKRT